MADNGLLNGRSLFLTKAPDTTSNFYKDISMRLSALLLLSIFSSSVIAEPDEIPDVTYPQLPRQAPVAEKFVPSGWKLEKQERADLNGDGKADLLLLLRQNEPRNIVSNEDGLGVDALDTNPRILAAAFGTASGYRLILENHTLIPRHDSPTIDDPLGEVSIVRGTLQVSLHFWASAGSWSTSQTKFTFRYQEGCFKLIGYDSNETHRASGETTNISVNYSTRKMSQQSDNISEDKPGKTIWKSLPARPKLCLDEIGNGWNFSPEQ